MTPWETRAWWLTFTAEYASQRRSSFCRKTPLMTVREGEREYEVYILSWKTTQLLWLVLPLTLVICPRVDIHRPSLHGAVRHGWNNVDSVQHWYDDRVARWKQYVSRVYFSPLPKYTEKVGLQQNRTFKHGFNIFPTTVSGWVSRIESKIDWWFAQLCGFIVMQQK